MQPARRSRWAEHHQPGGEAARVQQHSRAALFAAGAIFLVHFALLAASVFDYRITIDSAYHIAMARQWGEHGLVLWDKVNFGPRGRPNLQGPLFQAAIGALGRMLGGSGADYVLANAILSLAQWTAAIATVAFFAVQLGDEWAALFAVSLLSGAAFSASSFAVGIPSGWLFIIAGWAAWFFIRGRPVWVSIAASAAIYMHIAGFAMAPLTILIAAALTRRWRELVEVGLLTAVLTAPYSIHVLRYRSWFSGAQSHSALLFDPMLDLLAVAGALAVLRRPRANAFLIAWLFAPLVWLIHDPCRLILQSGMAGSVAAGLMLSAAMRHFSKRRALVFGCAIAAIATIFPLGIPELASEVTWDAGLRYPRAIDWTQTSKLGAAIARAGLANRLIDDYQPALCPAIAVFTPISCEKGHWIEVQPRRDPVDNLPATDKVYIVPLPQADPALGAMERRHWISSHASVEANTIITISGNLPPDAVGAAVTPLISSQAQWLVNNAVNNTIQLNNWQSMTSRQAARKREVGLRAQRLRAGRIELATLVYAASVRAEDPEEARSLRRIARGFGVIASFLSDGFAIDYISAPDLASLKLSLAALARISARPDPVQPNPELIAGLNAALATVLDTHGDTFAERPAGNPFPWWPRS